MKLEVYIHSMDKHQQKGCRQLMRIFENMHQFYENIKDYSARIKPWSGRYAGIIVGPCPHKAKDINGYSSFIEKIKSEEGYPHVEEARDKSGALKISNSSVADAMLRMAVYLQSIA